MWNMHVTIYSAWSEWRKSEICKKNQKSHCSLLKDPWHKLTGPTLASFPGPHPASSTVNRYISSCEWGNVPGVGTCLTPIIWVTSEASTTVCRFSELLFVCFICTSFHQFVDYRRISNNLYTLLIRTSPFLAKDAYFRTLIHLYM